MARDTHAFAQGLALSIGMALATSCLAMVARLGAEAGRGLLPAMAIALLLALAVAHAVGRLAARFPSALGVRTYVKAAFGDLPSLVVVFAYLLMIALVAGVESNLYADVLRELLPAAPPLLVVPAVFALVLACNAAGAEFSRRAQLGLVAFMLLGLLALSATALAVAPGPQAAAWAGDVTDSALPSATPAAAAHGWSLATLAPAAVGAFFLYVGFEWVTSAQPGSRRAAAQLPGVLLSAVAVLGLTYLAFGAAMLAHLGPDQLAATRAPQLLLADAVWGPAGRWLLLAVSTAAVLMAFNAGVIGAARLVYGLAREGLLPAPLARTSPGRGTPLAAIALTVGLSLACSAATRVLHAADLAAQAAAVLVCGCYAALLSASLVLARRQPRPAPRWAQPLEAGALATMAVLLLAMLAAPGARPPALLAAAVLVTAAALALAARRRRDARPAGSGLAPGPRLPLNEPQP